MGNWLKGILILALLAIFASFVWPFNANKRSAEMGATIQDNLNSNGFDFAKVNMSGNVARLSGTAPNEAASKAATDLAANTKCKACEGKKIWHKVVSDLDYKKNAMASPYVFNAVKSDAGAVVLDGYVRNDAEKARVLREAENLFPGQVTDRTIKIAAGEPNASWGDIVSSNLKELSMLDRGQFNISDKIVSLTGHVGDADVKAGVDATLANLPNGYEGRSDVAVPQPVAVETLSQAAVATCQTLLDELKGVNKINFELNKAGIKGESSFNLLNALGAAAKAPECASARINVVGHTDSGGSDAYNQGLSERRAASVVAYLVQEQDIDITRISAEGKGETSPIADNATAVGRAANRRIEFIVTQAQ